MCGVVLPPSWVRMLTRCGFGKVYHGGFLALAIFLCSVPCEDRALFLVRGDVSVLGTHFFVGCFS